MTRFHASGVSIRCFYYRGLRSKDTARQVVLENNFYLQQTDLVFLALSLPAPTFQEGRFYRLYYQLLATPDNIVYEGYGDLLICATDYLNVGEDCF